MYEEKDLRNGAMVREDAMARVGYGFMSQVYAIMSFGLIITAFVAWIVASSPDLVNALVVNKISFIILILAEIGLVIWLSAFIKKMSGATATAGFIAYSALNGVTLSVVLLAYAASSVAGTFFITAGTFAGLSAFGYFTRRSLSGIGSFCIMGLWGLILATVVNMFMRNAMLDYALAYVGVLIFAGLTAYDTQKLKELAASGLEGEDTRRFAVLGALELYLDFINLFLFLLRIFGGRK